jgi:flagellar protein FlaF
MGFSVSASAAIIFAAMFISMGILYPAVANGMEDVSDARADSADVLLDQQNTAISVANVSYDAPSTTLTVDVDNTGTTDLSLDATDVLVNNSYATPSSTAVEGDTDTDLWLPGERLTVTVDVSLTADGSNRVVVVTNHGISRAEVL